MTLGPSAPARERPGPKPPRVFAAEAIEVAGGLSIAIEKLKKLVNGKIFKMFLSLTFGPKVSKLVKYFQKKSKKPAESEKNESTIYLKNYIKELIIEMDLKENNKIM